MSDVQKNAALVFPDGKVFKGYGVGKKGVVTGEICFNTAITGYQEILTDPSYFGQIITFTFPHIGNIGVNEDDIEAKLPKASGLIIRENITEPSSYRSSCHLNGWLEKHGLTGISGVDTRQITRLIRKNGAKNVAIIFADEISNELIAKTVAQISQSGDLKGVELASKASLNKEFSWGSEAIWQQTENSYHKQKNTKFKVVAIDFGAKLNILRCLTEVGCDVEVVGAKTSFNEIKALKPDGVFLSNGPGDPAETAKFAVPVIQEILENNIPLFGICLGHQLLALAIGAKTVKMTQGHRGANHPVLNLQSKKVEITSQNHGFCVDEATLPQNAEVTHISLFDKTNEGIRLKDKKAFSVQHHPESSPGPSDSFYLFEEFVKMMEK
jgi:carbamoyl-phosphate synthase small subunit